MRLLYLGDMTQLLTPRTPLADVVDVERYPIDRSDDIRLTAIIKDARDQLDTTGCMHLPGFIRWSVLDRLQTETDAISGKAHMLTREMTPYGDDGASSSELPESHPRRRVGFWSNGFVGKDLIPADTMIRSMYDSQEFMNFIASCLGLAELHQFFDPIRGLVVNVMGASGTQAWHYDANEFVVSLMTRRPQSGGAFEFCPNLRTPGDEHYDDVGAVMDGDRSLVRSLELEVGDLQLFRGRYSLHRVAPVTGERHTALFGFSETSGYISNVETTMLGYGRVTQAHIDADPTAASIDGLAG